MGIAGPVPKRGGIYHGARHIRCLRRAGGELYRGRQAGGVRSHATGGVPKEKMTLLMTYTLVFGVEGNYFDVDAIAYEIQWPQRSF